MRFLFLDCILTHACPHDNAFFSDFADLPEKRFFTRVFCGIIILNKWDYALVVTAMEKNNIILNVRGSHVEQGEENILELMTEGRLTRDDDKYIIEYEESALSGVENTTTRLTVQGDKLWLNRMGILESEFAFKKRQMYEAAYDTPFGMLQLSVLPTQIESEISEDSGQIDLEYVVNVGGKSALNRLNIHYKRKN